MKGSKVSGSKRVRTRGLGVGVPMSWRSLGLGLFMLDDSIGAL